MNSTKSLIKAFEILEIFLEVSRSELRLSEIAKLTGLKTATANRIASTLVNLGYLSQPEKRGKYALGSKFLYYENILHQNNTFKDVVRPFLLKLNDITEETVNLVKFDGYKILYVENIVSKHLLSIHPEQVTSTPLFCSGVGKVFLADMTETELVEYFKSAKIQKYTPNTITDPDLIKRNLVTVSREGVAYDDEELNVGVRNVAAPVRDNQGNIFAAVGVLGPTVRLTRKKMNEFSPEVKKCALDISHALGFKGSGVSRSSKS